MRAVALTALCLAAASSGWAQTAATRASPAHFIYFGLDRHRITDAAFLATAAVAGAQLKYTWRELEPERGEYAFDAIRLDLAFLERSGKRLFIQLQDVSFDEGIMNVPDYLLEDPTYGGGVALKYEFEDDDESRPVVDGWVARRWDPAVRERLADLFVALAEELDGRIAGINLAETSIGFGRSGALHPAGFSYEAYLEGVLDLMSSLRRAFSESDVIIYANFMPGEELPGEDHGYLRAVYEHADRIGAGVGGPDLRPYRWFQRQNSLPLIAARAAGTVAGVAVQYGNLDDINPDTGERVTVPELVRFATDQLRLDYLFWGAQEPYLSKEILPYLQGLENRAGPTFEGRNRPACQTVNRNPEHGRGPLQGSSAQGEEGFRRRARADSERALHARLGVHGDGTGTPRDNALLHTGIQAGLGRPHRTSPGHWARREARRGSGGEDPDSCSGTRRARVD